MIFNMVNYASKDENLIPENIKNGVEIDGVVGTYPNGLSINYIGSGTVNVDNFSTVNGDSYTTSGSSHAYKAVGGMRVEYSPNIATETISEGKNLIAVSGKIRIPKSITFTQGSIYENGTTTAISTPIVFEIEYSQTTPSDNYHISLCAFDGDNLGGSSTYISTRIICPSKRYVLLGYDDDGTEYPKKANGYVTYYEYEYMIK